jgi:imidazoleglycerol phosphate dehydratase HisB
VSRSASEARSSKEADVKVELEIDGSGDAAGDAGLQRYENFVKAVA